MTKEDVTPAKVTYHPAKPTATCMHCGAKGPIMKQSKNGKSYPRPFYKAFEQVSWFRGDDEYLGTVCRDCYKKRLGTYK